jgi:hypothetical protein
MAEIELSALGIECLNRRIGNLEELSEELSEWQQKRNEKTDKVAIFDN